MTKWIATLSLLLASSCSHFGKPAVSRRISVKPIWVKTSTIEDKLRARFLEPMQPVVHEDAVYYGNSIDSFSSYSKKDGRLLWRVPIENGASGGAVIYKDSILFGGNDGHFYRLRLSDGARVWSYPTRSEALSAPTVEDGKVFFLSGNGTLFALEVETGEKIWVHSRRNTTEFSIRGGSQPVIRSGKLFVGFSDGSIVALQTRDGKVLWEQRLNRNKKFRDIDSTAVISGFELLISGYDDALYSLDWSTGDVNWKFASGGVGSVLLTDQLIYMPTSEGEMVALDRKTGKKKWSIDVKGVASTPQMFRGYLVYGESDGFLKVVDSNSGRTAAHFEPGRGVFTPPSVTESGEVFFASNQSNIYAVKISFDAETEKWPWEN